MLRVEGEGWEHGVVACEMGEKREGRGRGVVQF